MIARSKVAAAGGEFTFFYIFKLASLLSGNRYFGGGGHESAMAAPGMRQKGLALEVTCGVGQQAAGTARYGIPTPADSSAIRVAREDTRAAITSIL